MALSINVSYDEEQPFTPGSLVPGVIRFTAYEDWVVESLTVNFKGLAKVFLNQYYGDLVGSRTDYTSQSYLFSRHLNLHSGECVQRKGTYDWPFAFRIPLFAAPRAVPPGSRDSFYPQEPWKGDMALVAHPLPPSMRRTGKFVCTVQYGLEAAILHRSPATNGSKSKCEKMQATRSITVQSLDMGSCRDPGNDWPYTIQRYTMLCDLADASRGPVRRLLSIFPRDGGHRRSEAKLCFSVLLPKKLEIKAQQALSVPVSCTMDRTTSTQELGPSRVGEYGDLAVSSFKISLVQRMQVRAGSHTDSSVKRIFTRKGCCKVPISVKSSASQKETNTLASTVNLCDTTDLSVPAELLAADFSTYNIARSHSLDVFFCIKHQWKKHRFALRDVPIRVVPESGRQLEMRLSEGLEEDDEQGCHLAGIQWQDYQLYTSGTRSYGGDSFQAIVEDYDGNDDLAPETPPPTYSP